MILGDSPTKEHHRDRFARHKEVNFGMQNSWRTWYSSNPSQDFPDWDNCRSLCNLYIQCTFPHILKYLTAITHSESSTVFNCNEMSHILGILPHQSTLWTFITSVWWRVESCVLDCYARFRANVLVCFAYWSDFSRLMLTNIIQCHEKGMKN